MNKLTVACHYIIAIILMTFAASHFAFLSLKIAKLVQIDPVFPFLAGRWVFVAVGTLEATLALFIVLNRGKMVASISTIAFISLMIWYRFSANSIENGGCSCLGALGVLLNISKENETKIPNISLVALFALSLPGFLTAWRKIPQRAVIIGLLGFLNSPDSSSAAIVITGEVSMTLTDPGTGRVYSKDESIGDFKVIIDGGNYYVSVVNRKKPTWWATFTYLDGVGVYCRPSGGFFYHNEEPSQSLWKIDVDDRPYPMPDDFDPLGFSAVCLAYMPAERLTADVPLLWRKPRINPAAYGYSWTTAEQPENSVGLAGYQIVRALDSDLRKEWTVPNLPVGVILPKTVAEHNQYISYLEDDKEVPNSFSEGRYECKSWEIISGHRIPKLGTLVVNLSPYAKYIHSWMHVNIVANAAEEVGTTSVMPPEIMTFSMVRDFRYGNENKGKRIDHVSYTIERDGELRGPDDQDLHQQSNRISAATNNGISGLITKKHVVSWSLFLLIFSGLVLMIVRTIRTSSLEKKVR